MSDTEQVIQSQQESPEKEIEKLTKTVKSGAYWFYWIAGLSLINSVLNIFHANRSFVVGLGITQMFDAAPTVIAERVGQSGGIWILQAIVFFIALFTAGIFVLCGWKASKRKHWAFILGMILYFADTLLFLLIMDIFSLGFHGFALICIWSGFAALKKLEALELKSGLKPIVPVGG